MPTRYTGTPAEVRALDALIKLMRAAMTIEAHLGRWVRDQGLTETQFGVLETLHFLGPLSPSALGLKRLSSGANITTVLDNLEKRDLVRREASTDDRRCRRVQLTPEGRRLIVRIFPSHVAVTRELFSALTAEEQETLAALSRKLGLAIAARESRRSAPRVRSGPRPRRAAQSAGRK
jgi:MarR family 2-MHQ and catechol resistance regulon transcriptional repressor